MAAKTSVAGTGLLWSAGTTWADATPPVDGDTPITIPAGSEVIFDVDETAYATGHASVVVNGTLRVTTAASTTTYLKMATAAAAAVTGTGAFYMGNSAADPIPRSSRFTLRATQQVSTSAITTSTIRVYGWHPTDRNHTTLSDAAANAATEIYLTDTLDVAANEQVVIGNGNVNSLLANAQCLYTVQAYDAGLKKITLTAGLSGARNAGDVVAIVTRPVIWTRDAAYNYFYTNVANLYAEGLHMIGGAGVDGANSTLKWCTHSDNWANDRAGMLTNTAANGGLLEYCTSLQHNSGLFDIGIANRAYRCAAVSINISAVNFSHLSALEECVFQNSNQYVVKDSYGVRLIDCTAKNMGVGLANNARGLLAVNSLWGNGTLFTGYNAAGWGETSYAESVNHENSAGAFRAWTRGGVTVEEGTTVPSGFTRSYKTTLASATYPGWWRKLVTVQPGQTVNFTLWLRKSASMTYLPRVWVFGQGCEPFNATGEVLKTFTMTDSTDTWESDTYQYINSGSDAVVLEVRFVGMNGSGDMFGAFTAATGGKRGRIIS